MPLNRETVRLIEKSYKEAVSIRRRIHMYPELSGQEYKTAQYIYSVLEKHGFIPEYHASRTAVTASLGNGSGKTVVLRADTDALPVTEENDVPFKSRNSGVMHACGHDIHTASLIGAAAVLKSIKRPINGRLVFLFQPSEETGINGSSFMIKNGAFPEKTDSVFALHVNPELKTGEIGLKKGNEFTSVSFFDVTVKGKGGHTSAPGSSYSTIICASSMIIKLQSLTNSDDGIDNTVLIGVGSIQAGSSYNVIPDTVKFRGTLRTFSEELHKKIKKKMETALKEIAGNFSARADVIFPEHYPAGYNDPELTARLLSAFSDAIGKNRVTERFRAASFSEDFSYYQKITRGVFCHLGVRAPKKTKIPQLHSSGFLPDEEAIKTGITLFTTAAIELLA